MQRYRHIIVLGAAVLVALLTSLVTYNWMRHKVTSVEERIPQTRQVAVAVVDLGSGATIRKEMLRTVPYLAESLPEGGFFPGAEQLEGRVVISPVRAGEPVFASRLAPLGTPGGVAALLGPGRRAMAVRVDKVIGVAGFVQPGNRVDVLVTLAKPKAAGGPTEPITKTVLENVPVLAAGVELDKTAGEREKARQVDVITLEVSPEEGELLGLAATEGKIQLALRHPGDSREVLTSGSTVDSLLASYAPEKEKPGPALRPRLAARTRAPASPGAPAPGPAAAAGPAARPAHQVMVVRGTAMSVVNFVERGQ